MTSNKVTSKVENAGGAQEETQTRIRLFCKRSGSGWEPARDIAHR